MISRYPEYQRSRIQWLNEVPVDWKTTKIKYYYDVTLGKMLTKEAKSETDTLEYYLKAANIQWAGIETSDLAKMWFSENEKEKLRLEVGDLCVSEGGDVGRVAVWEEDHLDCYIQNAVNRIRSKKDEENRFLYYWIQFIKRNGLIDIICNKSTIAHYTAEKVENTEVVLPTVSEQRSIVKFLDEKTIRLDNLISEKQKFIDLLKAKRQSLISHFVTKGLDANVHLKARGDDWLGPIPNHWNLSKLKYVSKIFGRIGFKGYTTDDMVEPGDGAITLSPGNMKSGIMDYSKLSYLSWEKYEESPEIKIYDGDILMVKTGSTYGKVSYVEGLPEPATINPQIIVFKNITIIPKFLFYWLSSTYLTAISKTNNSGGTMPTMSQNNIENFKIALPNINEQTAIVEQIDFLNNRLRKIISEVETSISLLKEQRTALISAAVTGKIDVRNHDKTEAV